MQDGPSGRRIYFFGALGGVLFGYDTGVISGAILFIKKDFELTPVPRGGGGRPRCSWERWWARLSPGRSPTASAAAG